MAFPLLNIRFILLISASFIAIFSSIAIYFCLPILISHMIRTQLSISPSSGSFEGWRYNSAIDKVYLYNITNLNDILSESSRHKSVSTNDNDKRDTLKPKLKQIGPVAFRQTREKINIKFDTTNETVIYDQKKSYTFLPELSSIKTIDELNSTWINHMNVPLAGTTLNSEYAEFIEPIVTEFNLTLFLNNSFHTLLFEGYFDILMEGAKAQQQIDVDRFGWLHNQNNSITKNIRVFTGVSNATLNKLGAVDEYQHAKQFMIWHNNNTEVKDFSDVKCNEFRFSSAGEFYSPSYSSISSQSNYQTGNSNNSHGSSVAASDESVAVTSSQTESTKVADKHITLIEDTESRREEFDNAKDTDNNYSSVKLRNIKSKFGKSITLFMPDFCRTYRLFYNGSYLYKDLLVDRYIANELTYDYSEASDTNKCFCIYNENTKITSCPPNGMMDLYTCRKGSPLAISFPNFLYSRNDKSLAPYLKLFEIEDDGHNKDAEHQFFVDLEPTLNIPVNVQVVFQFNVHFRIEPSLHFTNDYLFLFENNNNETRQTMRDLYLPQMWIQSTAQIEDSNLNNLKFIQKHLDLVTPITTMTIFCFASILLMMSAKLAYDLTYGPKSRKSTSHDQESCSSLDRNHGWSYLEDKQKYYAMQLLGSGDGTNGSQAKTTTSNNNIAGNHSKSNNSHDEPTTSKADESLGGISESQPLNV